MGSPVKGPSAIKGIQAMNSTSQTDQKTKLVMKISPGFGKSKDYMQA